MTERNALAQQLLKVGPHGSAHWVAARAALTVAIPLVMLVLTDHVQWVLYAGFGAFTSLYGRAELLPRRLVMQSHVGVLLIWSVLLGVLVAMSDQRAWIVVPVATAMAALGAAVSDRDQWHPPGPLFLIFALGACASVPSTPVDLVPAFLVSGSTVVLAIVIGCGPQSWRAWRARCAGGGSGLGLASLRTPHPMERRHVARAALGVAVAGILATGLQIGHPYWAMVSAVVPLAARSLDAQVVRGIHRVVGTGLGLVVAGLLLGLSLPIGVLLVAIVALQAAAELLIGRNYAVALIAVTPLALLMVSLAAPQSTAVLLIDRAAETLIGVAVGVAVGGLRVDAVSALRRARHGVP